MGFGKRISGMLCGVVIVSAAVIGCGTTEPADPAPLGAIVGGISWTATEYSAERDDDGGIVITGSSAIDIALTLELAADTVGVYPLGTGLNFATLVDEGETYTARGTTAGSVTITSVSDDRITGYFGFTGKLVGNGSVLRDVTNGEFSLEVSFQ